MQERKKVKKDYFLFVYEHLLKFKSETSMQKPSNCVKLKNRKHPRLLESKDGNIVSNSDKEYE